MMFASKAPVLMPGSLPSLLLDGPRVCLRPPRATDWPQWAEVRGKNQAYLKPMEPVWPEGALTRAFFNRRLIRQARDWQEGRAYPFLIFRRDEKILIGGININNVCRGAAQFASLGYWLDEAAQGQGYMREALGLMIRYAFDDLKLHRLNAGCLPENTRSRRLLLASGFLEEGFARRYIQIDGLWQDHVLYGLTSGD